jgi:hypothetical protein
VKQASEKLKNAVGALSHPLALALSGWVILAAARLITGPLDWVAAALFGLAIVAGILLLQKSRIAWLIMLFGSVAELIVSFSQDEVFFWLISLVISAALLSPPTLKRIWVRGDPSGASNLPRVLSVPLEFGSDLSIRGIARLAGWERDATAEIKSRSFRILLWRLSLAVIILPLTLGALDTWRSRADGATFVFDVLLDAVWVGFMISAVGLLAALILAAYSWRQPKKPPSSAEI